MAAEVGCVIACHTKEAVDANIAKGKETGKLVIIDFTASWCGPCRVIAPVFAEYAKKFPGAIFLKVDVDELKDVAEAYNVEAMPTFMFIKDGEKVDTVVGGNKDDIHNKIVALMGPASASTDQGRRMAAEEGAVIACHTKEEFDAHMAKGKEAGKLVIIDFTASWCGPCRVIAPVFAEYAKKFPGAIFLKVDVDELKDVAEAYNVEAMPTFMFIKDGEKVDTVVGGNKDDIHNKLVALTASASA